jgi:hypothetical protein
LTDEGLGTSGKDRRTIGGKRRFFDGNPLRHSEFGAVHDFDVFLVDPPPIMLPA